jgi:hypothetical protein
MKGLAAWHDDAPARFVETAVTEFRRGKPHSGLMLPASTESLLAITLYVRFFETASARLFDINQCN